MEDPTVFPEIFPEEDESVPRSTPAGGSTGILLSTLWNQSGILSLGGNTTVSYNEYTPLDSNTGTHSMTGCTNTAAAQIIYFFIETRGLELTLTLTVEDEYTSTYRGSSVNIKADGSAPGTLSFDAVNVFLGSYTVDSAPHAAALLYACGVVQQAGYSSLSTATPWTEELFYRSGFVSVNIAWSGNSRYYYWGETGTDGKFRISDDGFEVIIENLQAGRPVGTSYPGHALVIDGYDADNDLFHINFGWGKSPYTRWYTREEMLEQEYHEFIYDLLLEPVASLTVNDGRLYGTGTLIRAFERASACRGADTVIFDAAAAGRTLELPKRIALNDEITVRNFNMTLIVTDGNGGGGFYGERNTAAVFENFGGALIVSSEYSFNRAFAFAGAQSLSLSTAGALIFSGSFASGGDYVLGAEEVLAALSSARETDSAVDSAVVSAASYAVFGTSADDLIQFADRTVTVGDCNLGDGDNTLTLCGHSRLYGKIVGGSGADTVSITDGSSLIGDLSLGGGGDTVTVDSSSSITGCFYGAADFSIVLDSLPAADRAICTATKNVYNFYRYAAISVDIADAGLGTYTLIAAAEGASYAAYLSNLVLTITGIPGAEGIALSVNGTASSRYADLICEDDALKLLVKETPTPSIPEVVSVAADITEDTVNDVTVTAVFNRWSATRQFSFDGSVWLDYPDGGVVMSANGTVYFRSIDAAGNLSAVTSYAVTNIDRTAPAAPTVSASTTAPTSQDVIVTALFSDDSVQKHYSFDEETWIACNAGIVMSANGTVYFRGIDAAGNISDVTSYTVTNIDRTAPVITLTGDDQSILHRTTLSAAVDDGSPLYYRIDGGEWREYTAALVVDANARYEFQATDAAGNTGSNAIVFTNILPEFPGRLTGSAEHLSWSSTGASRYFIEYSTDDFRHVIAISTARTALDTLILPAGTYRWQVRADGSDRWIEGETIVSAGGGSAQTLCSDGDGEGDLFFAEAYAKWGSGYAARHTGSVGGWDGTRETVSLEGKNRFADLFLGSDDPNILLLTDDDGGDALFVDDLHTGYPGAIPMQPSRIARIREIRAGAGDDIVDMTSSRFVCPGDGMIIRGGDGNDTLWANRGTNHLFGDDGNDRLVGASGNDLLAGGSGDDSMHGGGGSDLFTFGDNWGHDTVEQLASGSVTLWFASGSPDRWDASTLTYADGGNSVTVSGIGADRVTLKFGDDGSETFTALTTLGAFADATAAKIFAPRDAALLAVI